MLQVILVSGQSSPREYLYHKADSLFAVENFEQARYYYLLSMKQKGMDPSEIEIKKKVILLDSNLAYASSNDEFIRVITLADELLLKGKYIEALKFFDDASSIVPAFDYPHARIDQIINESEEVKKQLLIYNAKQNQLSYFKILNDIEALESEEYFIEAYYEYKEFAKSFHGDSLASSREAKLFRLHGQKINDFESDIFTAEELYRKGDYQSALTYYENARELNPKCNLCEVRLEHIGYCINEEICQGDNLKELFDEAKDSFDKGMFQKAYYQFAWLQNLYPENQEVVSYLSEIERLLETETDERMRQFNADITLEKANDAFMDGRYEDALKGYTKLKNAYASAIDYLQFVELRIAECLNEVSK